MKGNSDLVESVQSSSIWSKWFHGFIPATFVGMVLFLVSSTIVLTLIPLYIPTQTMSAGSKLSSLIDLKYNIPRTLISDLSENTMVLRLGNLSDDRVKLLEEIFQSKLQSNPNFKNLRIGISQANIQSTAGTRTVRTVNQKQIFRRRRLVNKDNVIIYQEQENPTEADQLRMSFRLLHREPFTKSLISSAVANIVDRIVSNATTFLALFGDTVPITSLTARIITHHVKDNEIIKVNNVRIFGIKDYTGNVQTIYAIQTDNAIYTIKNRNIVRIQSMNQTLLFNYINTGNQYKVLLVLPNNSYEIPVTYQKRSITFPNPVFNFPQNESLPNIFTGILLELHTKISNRLIDDATVLLNYFDKNYGNKSLVMLNVGGGRYYAPLPTNDSIFDMYFNKQKFLTTITSQSDAYLQMIQSYPMADICSRIQDDGKAFCSLILQEMTITIPNVLRATYQNISQFQWQSQSFGQLSGFEAIAFLPGEESVRIPLNARNQIETILNTRVTRNVGSTNSGSIDPNKLNTFSEQVGGGRGQCNEHTVAGGDIPDDKIIDIGKSNVTVKFAYETYDIKDQIDVYYMKRPIFSTGCVGANGETYLSLNGHESTLSVKVTPNCAGDTNTAWDYSFECPNELICEDNVCYCGFNRRRSRQIKNSTWNGCGGKNDNYNFLIQTIGALWAFTQYCNEHDKCYGECNSLRTTCDLNFIRNMWISCLIFLINPATYNVCQNSAVAFYVAVRLLGADYFVPGQKENCECVT